MSSQTKYFVDARGKFLGAFTDGAEPPENATEVPTAPAHGYDTWMFGTQSWKPWEPPVEIRRLAAYQAELGGPGDQFDAIYKGLSVLVPALVKSGAIPPEVAAALLPDASAPVDTPPGWLGKVAEIKARYPKEGK